MGNLFVCLIVPCGGLISSLDLGPDGCFFQIPEFVISVVLQ